MCPELLGTNEVVVGVQVMLWLILLIVPFSVNGREYLEA
jgi:hypothetical protein